VTAVDNHYEFLGLEPSASQEAIEAAVEHVSEQAITLVYTSPQRSSDLWERIRQMRRDLLATPEGRQVYDEALLRRQEMTGEARMASAGTTHVFRPAEAATPVPVTGPAPVATRVAFSPMPEEEQSRAIAWPYALVAAAAVFVAVVGALLAHDPGVSPARKPVAMTLSQLGSVYGSKFVSGHSITLAWTKVPHASVYHLQIVTAPGDPSDSVVFAHGSTTVSVSSPQYHLKVTGQQLYYWRVQALVGGLWQRYTPSRHFAVARPQITRPVALAPVTGSGKGGKHVRLCWSPVRGATGYRLRVQGQRTRTVQGTCITLSVRPRTYHWSVAALVKGVGVYTGAYSVAAVLQVHRATAKKSTHHRSTRHVTMATRSTSRGGITTVKHRTSSTPIEIALALPRHTASNTSRTRARSARRSPPSKVSAMGRTAHAAGHARKTTSRAHRTVSTTDANGAAGVKLGGTPVRATSVPARHLPSKTHTPVSPTHAPKTPSTPTKTHTPVVASRVPAPPAPPAAPTRAAAATVPAPTRGVTTTGAATSQSPIFIRPIVAPQVATNTPRSGTPAIATTSAPPAVHPPGPVPTNTKATVPTSAPVQPTPRKHPEHPEHPAHPVHPEHP
jgi:hypothetical protein